MKKIQLLLVMFTICVHVSYPLSSTSQPIKGSHKNVPFTINRVDISLASMNDFVADPNAFSKFVTSGKYSKEDFSKVLTLAMEKNFPTGINTPEKLLSRESEIQKYKSFYQGSWLQVNSKEAVAETYYLFWIPREDNLSMASDMIPTTEDGIYFILNITGFDTWKLPSSTTPNDDFIQKMKAKHSKKNSIKLNDPYNTIAPGYGLSMEFSYKDLVINTTYSQQEFVRIKELAEESNWPTILFKNNTQRPKSAIFGDMTSYTTYLITTITDNNGVWDLVWIPKEGNEHMSIEMQPKTNEGFFAAVRKSSESDEYKRFAIRSYTPSGRLNKSIAGKNPNATISPQNQTSITSTNTTSNTNSNTSPTTYTSGNISTSSYALDIFSERGSMVIYKGSTMYVVKVKGKKMQDQSIIAARANQVLGFTSELKYQWFPGNNCTTLKSKYGGSFTVICQGEIDLDK